MSLTFDANEGSTMKLDDDEAKLLDEISIEMPTKKTVPLRPKPSRPSPFTKRSAGPPPGPMGNPDDGLDMFMNPGKRTAPPPPMAEEFDGGEEDDEAEGFGPEGGQQQGGGFGGGGGEQMPSEGYKTIEDEKADLLNKITRLQKKGVQSSARLTIYSDIEEIRTEYKRMTYSIEVERSIKFQRRMLVACVTGLEFLNDKFDPFDLELNGWSQNTMENVEDYDGVFEELYNKYKTKVQVAPEVKLIMMVGGSAMIPPDEQHVQGGRPERVSGDEAESWPDAEYDGRRTAGPAGRRPCGQRSTSSGSAPRDARPWNGLWVPDGHDGTAPTPDDAPGSAG